MIGLDTLPIQQRLKLKKFEKVIVETIVAAREFTPKRRE
jgi:hypothetical protein